MQLAKIFFDGFEIHVPPADVARVVRELKQERGVTSPEEPPAPMQSQLPWPPANKAPPTATPTPTAAPAVVANLNPQAAWQFPRTTKVVGKPQDYMIALGFLEAIAAGNKQGMHMDGTTVGSILGVAHPRGIGSKAATINKIIGSLGFKVEEVYRVPRDSQGTRHWIPGPRIDEAIAQLSKEVRKQ